VTKIKRIRTSTSASSPPRIGERIVSELLSEFQPVATDEIAKILLKSTAKQCLLDPAPTWLIKQSNDIISPVIAAVCNASFDQVTFPHCCKMAIIRLRLKKPNLDPDLPHIDRSTALVFLSKVVEKVVDVRLSDHMNRHHLLTFFQSAYRPHHSTGTPLANDVILV